jgi:hypothetical protein
MIVMRLLALRVGYGYFDGLSVLSCAGLPSSLASFPHDNSHFKAFGRVLLPDLLPTVHEAWGCFVVRSPGFAEFTDSGNLDGSFQRL